MTTRKRHVIFSCEFSLFIFGFLFDILTVGDDEITSSYIPNS